MAARLIDFRKHSKSAGAPKPPAVPERNYTPTARWAKPLPKSRPNFIPAQSFLQYNWVDKDPDLEFAMFAIQESGWTLEQIELETERFGHRVSRYTLLGWMYGSTRRPHNATLSTVMAAIGWDRPWVRRG